MMAKLEVHPRGTNPQTWGWRLRADNGHIVATDGSQGYVDRDTAAMYGIGVKSGVYADAEVIDTDD